MKVPSRSFHAFCYLLFFAIFVYRIFLCAQHPVETSDLYRHLGYTSHLKDMGFDFYKGMAHDFAPEVWARYWAPQGYIYPPATALFFGFFSFFGLGIFWVKLAMTLIEASVALVFWRRVSPVAGLLMFSAPISLVHTSIEGQFEALLLAAMFWSVHFARQNRWLMAGVFFVLATQLKQFGILIFPVLLYGLLSDKFADETSGRYRSTTDKLKGFALGLGLACLPFLPFYYYRPDLWFLPLQNQGMVFNPVHWNLANLDNFKWSPSWLIQWNAVTSYLSVAAIIIFMATHRTLQSFITAVPYATFWGIFKSLSWAQFWYSTIVPAFIYPLARHGRWTIFLLALHWFQCGHSIGNLFGSPNGPREQPEDQKRFERCMWDCVMSEQHKYEEVPEPAPLNEGAPAEDPALNQDPQMIEEL